MAEFIAMQSLAAMPLQFAREPFDDPDYLYELKLDGFRAIAAIDATSARFISRRAYVYRGLEPLAGAVRTAVRGRSMVLDGELVTLDDDGRPIFWPLVFRRRRAYYYVFDLLECDGIDLRTRPLIERKRRLRKLLRPNELVCYVDHVIGRGRALFDVVCAQDLEGIVAKRQDGRYVDDRRQSTWIKIKNRTYSQAAGRHEFFKRTR